MFNAGRYEQNVPLAAEAANAMSREGCRGLTSVDIAEKLDFYGAWLQSSVSLSQFIYDTLFAEPEFR